jgi:hypothetical protein
MALSSVLATDSQKEQNVICRGIGFSQVSRGPEGNIEMNAHKQAALTVMLLVGCADQAIVSKGGTDSNALAVGVTIASPTLPPNFEWILVPSEPVVPGTLVDPDPDFIQDGGMNSSVVARLTRNGRPVVGETVEWSTSDSTAQVQYQSAKSDSSGLVRAWYLAGGDQLQKVTVRHASSGKELNFSLSRTETPSPTVGRYAAVYFTAPRGSYSATSITIIPKTAPDRTYYQLVNLWRTDGSQALYGGLQQLSCPPANPIGNAICSTKRGIFSRRGALFSVWDWTSPSGQVIRPTVVNIPKTSQCKGFDGEGTGAQCFAALDWGPNEQWRWTVEAIPGANAGYQRIRVTALNADKKIDQEIATIEVGGAVDMGNTSAFVENWGGNSAPTCLDVEERRLTITNVSFWNGQNWIKAISGSGMGGLYNKTMTRCQNYAFTPKSEGLEVTSGGKNLWVKVADSLKFDSATKKYLFSTIDQTLWQRQPIDITTLVNSR